MLGAKGCVLGATAEGLFPRGLGRSRAATPNAILLTRTPGPQTLGMRPGQRRSSRSSLSPKDPARPLRHCHPNPVAPIPERYQSRRISRGHGLRTVAVPSNQQLRWPVSCGPPRQLRGAAPGARGWPPPGTATWAMLCWEPGPRADGLSRGAGRTHPPIDLRRNAASVAGVTRPNRRTPWIEQATKGVRISVARRARHSAPSAFRRQSGWRGCTGQAGRGWRPAGRPPPSHGRSRLRVFDELPLVVGDLGQVHGLPGHRGRRFSGRSASVTTGP
jgi:hypothetical protein